MEREEKMNDDRLASLRNQVSRDPLVRGGTCLISHRLNSSRPERWEFRLSASYRWTTGILIGLGGVICGFAIAAGEGWAGERLFPIVLGGLFLLFGLISCFTSRRRPVFDFESGYYWRDRRNPRTGEMKRLRDALPLKEIAALQIVEEQCQGNRGSSYYSYELNLVKPDGTRLNVTDHGGLAEIREDAGTLAGRLQVPLWGPDDKDYEAAKTGDGKEPTPKAPMLRHRKGSAIALVAGVIFIVIGILLLWVLTLSPLLLHLASQRWEEVPARVTSSELVRSRSQSTGRRPSDTTYRIAISYEYQYGGKTYLGERYDITRSSGSTNVGVDEMRRIVRRHPVGMQTRCWVNPADPSQALIDRSLAGNYFLFMVWFPFPFLGLGVIAVMVGFKRR